MYTHDIIHKYTIFYMHIYVNAIYYYKPCIYKNYTLYEFHHSGITYQQVSMLTLLENRHQQLFCIKKTKNFSSYLLFEL